MVTLTADVTEGIKQMAEKLMKTGMYKSQSEIVRDAIRELAHKYNISTAPSLTEVRKIVSKVANKSGKTLSKTLREVRDQA